MEPAGGERLDCRGEHHLPFEDNFCQVIFATNAINLRDHPPTRACNPNLKRPEPLPRYLGMDAPAPSAACWVDSPGSEPAVRVSEDMDNIPKPPGSQLKRKQTTFVELKDLSERPLNRVPSKLSRSSTLHSLQDVARGQAAEKNNFRGYTQHNWFTSIRWIFKGSGMNVFVPFSILMTYSAVVVLVVETSGLGGFGDDATADLQQDVTVGLGGSMALLLAFRLNVCYSRWWEGRLLWGRVIEAARSLVTMALSLEADFEKNSPDGASKRAIAEGIAGWSIAFAVALKYHLREMPMPDDAKQLAGIERLLRGSQRNINGNTPSPVTATPSPGIRSANGDKPPPLQVSSSGRRASVGQKFGATAVRMLKHSAHPPLAALHSLRRHAIRPLVLQLREHGHNYVALESYLWELSGEMHGALTGCERILRTPCPPGYVGVLRVSLLFFLLLLPFVLLEISYYALIVVAMTAFVLLGAEEVAIQLEQPFGDDQNDLPLDFYCLTLEADLMTLLDEKLEMDDTDDE